MQVSILPVRCNIVQVSYIMNSFEYDQGEMVCHLLNLNDGIRYDDIIYYLLITGQYFSFRAI